MAALDELIDRQPPECGGRVAVLKLDVEGFELFALEGLQRSLRARRLRHLLFEFGGTERWSRHNQSAGAGLAALNMLSDCGYEVRYLHTHGKHATLRQSVAQSWVIVDENHFGVRLVYSRVPRRDLAALIHSRVDLNVWATSLA